MLLRRRVMPTLVTRVRVLLMCSAHVQLVITLESCISLTLNGEVVPEAKKGRTPVPLVEVRRPPLIDHKPALALLEEESPPPPLDGDPVPAPLEDEPAQIVFVETDVRPNVRLA